MPENQNIDARLLAGESLSGPAEERLAEKEMRQRAREEQLKAEAGQGEGDTRSLRQRMAESKRAKEAKSTVKDKAVEKATDPIKDASRWLLRGAWLTLVPSLGLSLIYINMHAFMRMVLPDMFCKLGDEWVPKAAKAGDNTAGNVISAGFGIGDKLALFFLDIVALFVFGSIFAFIVMVVDFMSADFLEKVGKVLGGLTRLGWGGIKALVELFR